MPTSKKKIETLQVILKTENNFTFEDILLHPQVKNQRKKYSGKDVQMQIVVQDKNYIIGIIQTTKKSGIPPKHNWKNNTFKAIDLEPEEGLGYGNVFLYEKARSILMYEFNKSGCYLDQFKNYIYKCAKLTQDLRSFEIGFNPILNKGEYEKMLSMKFYKSIEVKFANPKELLEVYKQENDAISNNLRVGSDANTDTVSFKMEVAAKKPEGLSSNLISSMTNKIKEVLMTSKNELVKKIEVKGYLTDPESQKLSTIDLLADRYVKYIALSEPNIHSGIQITERKDAIEQLYNKCLPDLAEILGKV